ncbi:hypothetical protein [Desulfosporosinus meridiei]|uniref:Uncharacterized protein n=1 Tax=Desulfosporosinus meridiei (strain ATCC BAA-275 / DSM 13257 / KCTC 12902 / NCIMB 13706 / S10) TaxID=768704 RepID=J7J4Q1_DESMD|nr:hypothetical protein [Desulfosporosinus meridiei]AFQ46258.1 hypothetical protein Desmer_4452 [Desulfosporosinus meridiei DSM 13257]
MAEKSSFFNSVSGDRKYQASDYAAYFNSFITTGVFPNPTTSLQAMANGGMSVLLKAGKAWINGYYYLNDSDLVIPIDVADGALKRKDLLVVRLDTVLRKITSVIKKGVFASLPVAPAIQRDADIYELALAEIYIGAGAIEVTQANITDLRMDTTKCGWVNSLIQVDTTAIFNQYMDWYAAKQTEYDGDFSTWTTDKKDAYDAWVLAIEADQDAVEAQFQDDFIIWFNSMKDQLSVDAAGNLQLQIDSLTEDLDDTSDVINAHMVTSTPHRKGLAGGITPLGADVQVPREFLRKAPSMKMFFANQMGLLRRILKLELAPRHYLKAKGTTTFTSYVGWNTVTFGNTISDEESLLTNGQFYTAPENGYYLILSNLDFIFDTTTDRYEFNYGLFINGLMESIVDTIWISDPPTASGNKFMFKMHRVVYLKSEDKVNTAVNSPATNAGYKHGGANSTLEIIKL